MYGFFSVLLSMSVPAMSVFNGVWGNNRLIVELPPFEKCVCVCVFVCLDAVISLYNKLKDAEEVRELQYLIVRW